MNASYDKNAAIVVLPPVSGGRLKDMALRTWLAHSELTREPGPIEVLAEVVRELGLPYPEQGLAALRMWGADRRSTDQLDRGSRSGISGATSRLPGAACATQRWSCAGRNAYIDRSPANDARRRK